MAKKKTESAKAISYRPSQAVSEALEAYRAGFDFKPDKSAVIERALRDFLKKKGFAIPEDKEAD